MWLRFLIRFEMERGFMPRVLLKLWKCAQSSRNIHANHSYVYLRVYSIWTMWSFVYDRKTCKLLLSVPIRTSKNKQKMCPLHGDTYKKGKYLRHRHVCARNKEQWVEKILRPGMSCTSGSFAPHWQRQPFMLNLHIIKYKRKEVSYSPKNFDMLRWNSWTAFWVEVSGYKLGSS